MSKYDYELSKVLELAIVNYDPTDKALLMAVMRRADFDTLGALRRVFPAVWDELQLRYNAPNGYLPTDEHPFLTYDDGQQCVVCFQGEDFERHQGEQDGNSDAVTREDTP